MMQLELDAEESEVVGQVLERQIANLEIEILHTDYAEFKAYLKRRREILERLEGRLRSLREPARA